MKIKKNLITHYFSKLKKYFILDTPNNELLTNLQNEISNLEKKEIPVIDEKEKKIIDYFYNNIYLNLSNIFRSIVSNNILYNKNNEIYVDFVVTRIGVSFKLTVNPPNAKYFYIDLVYPSSEDDVTLYGTKYVNAHFSFSEENIQISSLVDRMPNLNYNPIDVGYGVVVKENIENESSSITKNYISVQYNFCSFIGAFIIKGYGHKFKKLFSIQIENKDLDYIAISDDSITRKKNKILKKSNLNKLYRINI